MNGNRSQSGAFLLLGLFLALMVCLPVSVLGDDVLLAWGRTPFSSGARETLPVPTRVHISKSGINSAVARPDLGVALVEGGQTISAWSSYARFSDSFYSQISGPEESYILDLGYELPFLPASISQFSFRINEALVLNQFGELWHWNNSHSEPASAALNEFHFLSNFVERRFRTVRCVEEACVLHGMSGRFYISAKSGSGLYNEDFIPADPSQSYSNFWELDLSSLEIKTPISIWTMTGNRFVFVNGSKQVWEIGEIDNYGTETFIPVLRLDTDSFFSGSPITHLASTSYQTLVVTSDQNVAWWSLNDPSSPLTDFKLQEFLQTQANDHNNYLKQLVGGPREWLLLMDDGQIFRSEVFSLAPSRRETRDITTYYGGVTGNFHPTALGLEAIIPVYLGNVPVSHKIVSLSVSSDYPFMALAVAKPRSAVYASLAIELVDSAAETSSLASVITWGGISPMLGTGWSESTTETMEVTGMKSVSRTQLPENLREMKKVATGGSVVMALTATGTVLTWGCDNQQNVPCWHASPLQTMGSSWQNDFSEMPPLSIPLPLPPVLFNHSVIVDLSVGTSGAALLTDAGDVYAWNFGIVPERRRDNSRRRDDSTLSHAQGESTTSQKRTLRRELDFEDWNTAKLITGPFANAWINGPHVIVEDAVNHALLEYDLQNFPSEPTLLLSSVEVLYADMAESGEFVAVTKDVATQHHDLLLRSFSFPCPGEAYIGDFCNLTDSVPFALTQIRQALILDDSTTILLLTDNGVFYYGDPNLINEGEASESFVQIPKLLPVNAAQISKIAYIQGSLGLLTSSGAIYMQQYLEKLDSQIPAPPVDGNFYLIQSDFVFSDLPSHQLVGWGPGTMKIAIGVPRSSLQPVPASSDAISSMFLGLDSFCTSAMPNCDGLVVGEPIDLDSSHPVNSPSLTQLSISFVGSGIDGSFGGSGMEVWRPNDETGEDEWVNLPSVHRTLRWGAFPYNGRSIARYMQPTYQEPSVYINEASFEAAGVTLVKTLSVGFSQVSLYSNCSIAVQFYSDEGPTGYFGHKRSTWPNSGTVGAPQAVRDNSYARRVLKEIYTTDHIPMDDYMVYGGCGSPDAPAEDIQCQLRAPWDSPNRGGAPFHCAIRAGSRLFSFAITIERGGYVCDTGLLGPYQPCEDKEQEMDPAELILGLFELETTNDTSALSGKQVVQYALGLDHAVALTSDGSVVAWGSNSYDQLGLGDEADYLIEVLPTVPNAERRKRTRENLGDKQEKHRNSRLQENARLLASNHATVGLSADELDMRRESSLVMYQRGVPTRVALPSHIQNGRKVFAAGWSSFVLTRDHLIYGWGDNYFGTLGRGEAHWTLQETSNTPARVSLPFNAIRDASCAVDTCYALYESGTIYSWGADHYKLLARDTPANLPYSSQPGEAKKLKFKNPSKMIKELFVGPGMLLVRGKVETPPIEECPGSAPSAEFICLKGVWTIGDSLELQYRGDDQPAMLITGPTKILGNFTVPAGESIQIFIDDFGIFADPEKPVITVTGCFQGGGEIEFKFAPRAWAKFKNEGNGKQLTTIESSCEMQADGIKKIQAVDAPDTCQKASASGVGTNRDSGRFGLQSTFTMNNSRCTKWWMILLCVIAVVVIICLVAAIVWHMKKKKAAQTSSQRLRTPSVRAN